MSLWTDFIGAEFYFVNTPTFGKVRVAESGKGNAETVILLHGVGGHIEAYSKNIVELGKTFHVIAYDFPGHGQSSRNITEFSPKILADHLAELMDVLGVESAHVSGESLGGWVGAFFANNYPERIKRLVLNTTAGIPIASEQGYKDLENLKAMTARNANLPPTFDSVLGRMQWLLHESNWPLLTDELVETRLAYYQNPENAISGPAIGKFMSSDLGPHMIDLEALACETLFFWTKNNPIHDLAAAEAANARVANSALYVMKGDAAHWPQYEHPEEFNVVFSQFLLTGKL